MIWRVNDKNICFIYFIVETRTGIEENQWHHFCITLENTEDDWQFYKDGKLADTGTGKMINHTIPSGGTVVIGQNQTSMGGGFDYDTAFGPGEVTEVNLWGTVLSASDIAAQHANCTMARGQAHSWAQLKDGVHGDVQIKEPWFKQVTTDFQDQN